ncbi:MAG: hypothetical protein R3C01_01995 [Planctomycetaceae bacterium]
MILVNLEDGVCRSCGGQLAVVGANDCSIEVECQNEECSDCYPLEPDALNDGGIDYWPRAMAEFGEEGFE